MGESHARQSRRVSTTKGQAMNTSNASLNRASSPSAHLLSGYEATHQGGLNVLGKGRTTASWSQMSPQILGDIDVYVHALARR
jgi:hypothetical protein